MTGYILRRLVLLLPVLLGVTLIVFLMMALLPGDPALAILGPYATPENTAAIRADMGLDKPLPQQYLIWLGNVLAGDLGRSYSLGRPVIAEIVDRLGPTLILTGAAFVLCLVFGVVAGLTAAVRQYGWADKVLSVIILIGISTPSFWLAVMLILAFAVTLGWFPVSGMISIYAGGGVGDLLHHLVLPAVALAVVAAGIIGRMTRTNMLEVLRQDFVRTARAKGLKEPTVIWRHAFKNALVPLVPVIGLEIGYLFGGAIYIETVFQWPGMGRMLVQAVESRDLLLVQGGVLVLAVFYVLVNLLVDIAQRALDPRVSA